MFALATLTLFLASTTLFFGVMWWRERVRRKRGDKRLEAQEASFAAALGSTHAIAEQTREAAKRMNALEREIAIMRPVFAEMRDVLRRNT